MKDFFKKYDQIFIALFMFMLPIVMGGGAAKLMASSSSYMAGDEIPVTTAHKPLLVKTFKDQAYRFEHYDGTSIGTVSKRRQRTRIEVGSLYLIEEKDGTLSYEVHYHNGFLSAIYGVSPPKEDPKPPADVEPVMTPAEIEDTVIATRAAYNSYLAEFKAVMPEAGQAYEFAGMDMKPHIMTSEQVIAARHAARIAERKQLKKEETIMTLFDIAWNTYKATIAYPFIVLAGLMALVAMAEFMMIAYDYVNDKKHMPLHYHFRFSPLFYSITCLVSWDKKPDRACNAYDSDFESTAFFWVPLWFCNLGIVGAICIALWPIAVLVFLWIGFFRGLRGFVRLKKKVSAINERCSVNHPQE